MNLIINEKKHKSSYTCSRDWLPAALCNQCPQTVVHSHLMLHSYYGNMYATFNLCNGLGRFVLLLVPQLLYYNMGPTLKDKHVADREAGSCLSELWRGECTSVSAVDKPEALSEKVSGSAALIVKREGSEWCRGEFNRKDH